MATVLLVEDDDDIAEPLARALRREGYEVEVAADGPSGLQLATSRRFDLVVLDLGLPGLDGLELCRRLRAPRPGQAVLVLTARSDEIDVVVGLDAGADDYVAKPFRVGELLARIRALLRRSAAVAEGEIVRVGAVALDPRARRAWLADTELDLSPKEFDLLAVLIHHAGAVVTREQLIDEVWDEHWFGPTKTLDMHVSSLRRKLDDDPGDPRFISTVRRVGYRFERA